MITLPLDILGIKIEKKHFMEETRLPIFLRNEYVILQGEAERVPCLLMEKKGDLHLTELKKHAKTVENIAGVPCVFILNNISEYQKKRLIELRIAFLIPSRQCYMPFIGTVLQKEKNRTKDAREKLSISSQKILLTALYGNWKSKTVTEIANEIGFSKMTVSRCMDELENICQECVRSAGNKRYLHVIRRNTLIETYENWRAYLQNPIQMEVPLMSVPYIIYDLPLGGFSALSHYTLLAENAYSTYAVTLDQYNELKNSKMFQPMPEGEDPAAMLEVWKYWIPGSNKTLPDPISLAVSFQKRDLDDRTKQAIERMLEEYQW